ncbi:dihydrouridine synthase [Diplocarpon rosae]|nr:dihydrouridine synthase [Diplocarpon rosae]
MYRLKASVESDIIKGERTRREQILAKEFNRSSLARDSDFTLSTSPTPTIAQLGVNSPLEIYRSTLMLAPYVNGIDINCGCPQSWACAETLGAALMHHPELVCQMVDSAKSALLSLGLQHKKSISVKIRIHPNIQQTLDFVRRVEDAGVDFITVHGRTRRTPSSQPVNLDAIRRVKAQARVPVLGNGDVFTRADVDRIVRETGVNGVMSARGLLEEPGFFAAPSVHVAPPKPRPRQPVAADASPGSVESGPNPDTSAIHRTGDDRWAVLTHFVNAVVRAPIPFKLVVHHLSEMGGSDRERKGALFTKEQKRGLMECKSMLELLDWLDSVGEVKRL